MAATAAPAQPALSLDEALRLAESRSRQLPAQEAAAAAAREMAVAAGQRPDPVLSVGITNLPVDGPDRFSLTRDFMTMRSLGVVQELTRGAKLQARSARFEREAEVAEAQRALALAALRRDTAIAWLERWFLGRMRDALVVQRDEARLQIEAADAAYRAGRGAQADVFAARSAVAQVEDRIADAERQLATASTQLARWIGPGAVQALAGPPALDTVPLREPALEAQLQRHPQIAVMQQQQALAEAEAEVARSNKRADVSVELMFNQRGPAYSNMVSVNVSVPLQWDPAHRQDRELAAKLAAVEQARAQREEELRMRTAEAQALLQEWHSDHQRLQRYDRELLPLATERTRAAIASYRGAAGPLNTVLDARRAEIDTRIERLRLELNAARLWAQLSYLIPADLGPAAGIRP